MKPMVLLILDGCGIRSEKDGNAFANASKPNFDKLWNNYPHCILEASGTAVGLPDGQMGTSEVGHMNIGAGRVVMQPPQKINEAIANKSLISDKALLELINHARANKSNLHIMGLLSDGGVHSHIDHLLAIIDTCKANNFSDVYFDIFTDGRDTYEKSCLKFLDILNDKIKKTGIGHISSINGRYYAMDRDNNFDRVKKAYDAIVYGKGNIIEDYHLAINESYDNGVYDEFLEPMLLDYAVLNDNDAVLTFNFRKDRLRELFTLITNPEFYEKEAVSQKLVVKKFHKLKCLTMFPVVESVKCPHIFDDNNMKNILVDYLNQNNLKQLRISETEKFSHVTFFFDGGKEIDISSMEKILIPSPKVASYDLQPEMSVYQVTDEFIKNVDKFDVVIMNFANGDMVGHTGNYDAAVEAVSKMDECIGKVFDRVNELQGTLMIIADHGNCDIMWDEDHKPVTSHTTNPVPCIITVNNIKLNNGRLCDVAPTMLNIMGLRIPEEMNGNNLIQK